MKHVNSIYTNNPGLLDAFLDHCRERSHHSTIFHENNILALLAVVGKKLRGVVTFELNRMTASLAFLGFHRKMSLKWGKPKHRLLEEKVGVFGNRGFGEPQQVHRPCGVKIFRRPRNPIPLQEVR